VALTIARLLVDDADGSIRPADGGGEHGALRGGTRMGHWRERVPTRRSGPAAARRAHHGLRGPEPRGLSRRDRQSRRLSRPRRRRDTPDARRRALLSTHRRSHLRSRAPLEPHRGSSEGRSGSVAQVEPRSDPRVGARHLAPLAAGTRASHGGHSVGGRRGDAHRPGDRDRTRIDRGRSSSAGPFGAALRTGEAVSLTDARARKVVPFYKTLPSIESACAVPVREHGTVRGILVADRDRPEPFTGEDVALLTGVTDFVLRTIENERVFVQLYCAKVEQGKLYRAVDQLALATTEAQVIEAGVSSAREFAAFDFAVVTLFHRDGQQGTHEICAASGTGARPSSSGQSFRHNGGLVSMVIANKHPCPTAATTTPRARWFTRGAFVRPTCRRSSFSCFLVHDSALGTLVLGSSQRSLRRFGANDARGPRATSRCRSRTPAW
jgi:GAF domain-containing protein